MKPTLALSSCWNSHRHNDGYEMLREIADMGFSHVELSHGVKITLVPGVLRALKDGVVEVSSVHNFCPLPIGVDRAAPNLYEPSAADPREIDQWFRNTKRTFDFASQVGAKVCVLHLGSVRFWLFPPGRAVRNATSTPGFDVNSGKYQAVLQKAYGKLRGRMPTFWAQVKTSLERIMPVAQEKNIKLGCENREKFEELPLDADYAEFIRQYKPELPIGYWHDTGHAHIKQRIGALDHKKHLEANASRLLGFHLHDVDAKGHDHHAVGYGEIDFDMVSSFWRPHHLLTLELSPRVPPDAVVESRRRVLSLIDRMPEA